MHRATRQAGRTILLVEANPALRRMITLGLRSHGLGVIEADLSDNYTDLRKRCPDLILLDIDGEAGSGTQLLEAIQANPLLAPLPMVMLAWESTALPGTRKAGASPRPVGLTTLAKPFDARALYATIETQLLEGHQPSQEQAQAASRAITHVTYAPPAAPTAPSLCPILTAAGLMLSLIGLMLQLAITAIGLVIVIAALLWWTLGTKPDSFAVAGGRG